VLHSIRDKFDDLGLQGINLTPVEGMQGVNVLVENLNSLYSRHKFYGYGHPEITFTAQEEATLAEMMKAHAAYIAKYPEFRNSEQGILLGNSVFFISELMAVYHNPLYTEMGKNDAELREELCVKLMKGFIQCYYYKVEFAEFFLKVLGIPEVPNLAEGLRHDHNQLLVKYRDTVLLPERIMGDLYLEAVAERLYEQGVETGFNFGRGRG
jgi:hypothetical protein